MHSTTQTLELNRSEKILKRKFIQYLPPTIMIGVATSLSEFVDGIVVSNLCGSESLAIVNMGMPVTLICAMLNMFLGQGGATEFAIHMGKLDKKEAKKIYTVSISTMFILGILITIFGSAISGIIAALLLGNNLELLSILTRYLKILFCSAPVLVPVVGLTYFVRNQGNPNAAMAVHIIANVFNLIFDFIYIGGFDMGVYGAALATITGYVISLIFLIFLSITKKLQFMFCPISLKDFRRLPKIFSAGSGTAFGQLGYVAKIYVTNFMANLLIGTTGLVAFSVCMQTISITCIFWGSIVDVMVPIMSVLVGEKDEQGISYVLKRTLKYALGSALVCTIFLELFPGIIAILYNITEPSQLAVTLVSIRIINLANLFRVFAVVMMVYLQVIGYRKIATTISLIDGIIVLIPAVIILGFLFGMPGICFAYPVTAICMCLYVWYSSKKISLATKGQRVGILMLKKQENLFPKFDITIEAKKEQIQDASEGLIAFMKQQETDKKIASLMGIIIEEMCVFTMNYEGNQKKKILIDILAERKEDGNHIHFRSTGVPFDATSLRNADDGQKPIEFLEDIDNFDNIAMLNKIAKSIKYDNIIGLNCTEIIV